MNPGYRSPATVLKDPAYVKVDERDGQTWSASVAIVVMHRGTETYWRTCYSIRDDDSDYDDQAYWTEVVPKTITTVIYEKKT